MPVEDIVQTLSFAVTLASLMVAILADDGRSPGRRRLLWACILSVGTMAGAYAFHRVEQRRAVERTEQQILAALVDRRQTYDELRENYYHVATATFDAALENALTLGSVQFKREDVRGDDGAVLHTRVYFRPLSDVDSRR